MSSLSNGILTILAVDFAFAMLTGMTGIHGLIVDGGASVGNALGITPLFGAEANPVGFMAPITGAETALPVAPAEALLGDCHFDNGSMHCAPH